MALPSVTTRRQKRKKSGTLTNSSNLGEKEGTSSLSKEVVENQNKMADEGCKQQRKESSSNEIKSTTNDDNTANEARIDNEESKEEVVDYPWSDDTSMDSNFDILDTSNKFKHDMSDVESWLEGTNEARMNRTLVETMEEAKDKRIEVLEEKVQRMIVEGKTKEKEEKAQMGPGMVKQMKEIMEEVLGKIRWEMDEGFKKIDNKVKQNEDQVQRVVIKLDNEIDEKFEKMSKRIKWVAEKVVGKSNDNTQIIVKNEKKSECSQARKSVADLAQLQGKAFESALDWLDWKYEQSTPNERMMAKVIELAKLDRDDKEKWKLLKLHLDATNIMRSEADINTIIDLIIVTAFDQSLKEKWRSYSSRRRGDRKLLIMRDFLEKAYKRALERTTENDKKEEGIVKCYVWTDLH